MKTLNALFEQLRELEIRLAVDDSGSLRFRPFEAMTADILEAVKYHKLELLTIVSGRSVSGVGDCDKCGTGLLGLPTFDGYTNRVCPDCGSWFRCVDRKGGPLKVLPADFSMSRSRRGVNWALQGTKYEATSSGIKDVGYF